MKKLLLILFLIPNLVMGESYLCISENAAGFKYNFNNKTYTSTTFKSGSKWIVKKVEGEWKAIPFGMKDDSFINGMTKCEQYHHESKLSELYCEMFTGHFNISIERLRFIHFAEGSWLKPDKKTDFYSDPAIEIGSCSSI